MNDIERALVARCKNGDIEAFETLISSYQKKAYNIAYRMMSNEEDAKDASQEALLKVYRYIGNFKEESSFSTWLYRIVTNTCLDELRKRKNMQVHSLDEFYEGEENSVRIELAVDYQTPESFYHEKEERRLILEAIHELSEEYKTVIILRELQELHYDEIAQILDCSIGTVKSRINRGRRILKEKIADKLELSKKGHV